MKTLLAVLVGVVLAANGLFMLAAPAAWYPLVPGVADTGPFNGHFIRDIGCAYLIAGLGVLALAAFGRVARGFAVAGIAFLLLHATVHVADALAGRADPHHLLADLPTVFGLPLLAAWLAWRLPASATLWRWPWMKRLARGRMRDFETRYRYDMRYVADMLEASPAAFDHYLAIGAVAHHREDVPLSAWYAAKLAAVLKEDCGSCVQLVADMALEAGVPPATVAAVVAGDEAALDDDTRLAWRYARATLAHDPQADEWRTAIASRWGERAVISLALTMAGTRCFPAIKYALGHGHACSRVRIADRDLVPAVQLA
jgi:uncharacterized protein YjeT (DUF2065 family)/alkylhydroperoxidase family enzyme